MRVRCDSAVELRTSHLRLATIGGDWVRPASILRVIRAAVSLRGPPASLRESEIRPWSGANRQAPGQFTARSSRRRVVETCGTIRDPEMLDLGPLADQTCASLLIVPFEVAVQEVWRHARGPRAICQGLVGRMPRVRCLESWVAKFESSPDAKRLSCTGSRRCPRCSGSTRDRPGYSDRYKPEQWRDLLAHKHGVWQLAPVPLRQQDWVSHGLVPRT